MCWTWQAMTYSHHGFNCEVTAGYAAGSNRLLDQPGTSMQQPTEQYLPAGHAPAVHAVIPAGHVAAPPQLGGNVEGSWPGHKTHESPPHGVPHTVFFAQVKHLVGSRSVASVQFGDVDGFVAMSTQPAASHTVQQPKQSQPGGVSGAQVSMHCCVNGTLHSAGL